MTAIAVITTMLQIVNDDTSKTYNLLTGEGQCSVNATCKILYVLENQGDVEGLLYVKATDTDTSVVLHDAEYTKSTAQPGQQGNFYWMFTGTTHIHIEIGHYDGMNRVADSSADVVVNAVSPFPWMWILIAAGVSIAAVGVAYALLKKKKPAEYEHEETSLP